MDKFCKPNTQIDLKISGGIGGDLPWRRVLGGREKISQTKITE